MSKLGDVTYCKLTLFEDGMRTEVSSTAFTLTDYIGKCSGEILGVFKLPLSMWMTMVRAAGSGKVQILYRSDVICLRTQFVIMLTRVLA